MKRSLGVRYLPLAGLVAIQLLIVAVAPSVQERQTVESGSGGFDANAGFQDPNTGLPVGGEDATGVPVGSSSGSGSGQVSTGSGGSGSSGSGSGGPGGQGGGAGQGGGDTGQGGGDTGQGGGGQVAQGDTSHCVGDRQYDPAIDFYAPPCVPKSNGQNPGETYQGVTGEEIKLILYYGAGDPAVNAILEAQGAFVEPGEHREYLGAVADFINANYELYGRKVVFEVFEGRCGTIPPDISCLQNEFRQLIQEKKPFAIQWNTSLCSACFAEMSKLRTINLGGWNFRDEFAQRWRPYHYDITMSGTNLAKHAAEFWCKQLAGNPAEYSRQYGDTTRSLGVIATNDPQNQDTIEIDLKSELAKCGADYGNRKYFYEQDISTADTQRRAGVLAMRGDAINPDDDATSVMCFCDLVAPAFLYQEEDTQQYYPENIVTGTGFMDTDAASQAYIGSVGCPQGNPCAFDGAFGFRSVNKADPEFQGAGSRVWRAAGRDGNPPFTSVDVQWDYWNLTASAIQMAGPNLNPETFEQGAFRLGARGDANHALRQISPGNYHWIQDVDRVYWSSTKTSSYNGERGTYIRLDEQRTALGKWGSQKLQLPAAPR